MCSEFPSPHPRSTLTLSGNRADRINGAPIVGAAVESFPPRAGLFVGARGSFVVGFGWERVDFRYPAPSAESCYAHRKSFQIENPA